MAASVAAKSICKERQKRDRMNAWARKKRLRMKEEFPEALKARDDAANAKALAKRNGNQVWLAERRKTMMKKRHEDVRTRTTYYRSGAKSRNLKWDLNSEQAAVLFRLSCHYCGLPPNPLNGIDRKDPTQGYFDANCVPCCATCNYAKLAMNYAEFMEYIDRIAEYQKRKNLFV